MAKPQAAIDPANAIAARRIDFLLEFAKEQVREHEALAKRYVKLARAIALRHKIPLGRKRKHMFCKKCNMPWIAGYNLKVRLEPKTKRAIYICKCGAKKAFPYFQKRA